MQVRNISIESCLVTSSKTCNIIPMTIYKSEDHTRSFPQMCVMCWGVSETFSHLFLHCPMADSSWFWSILGMPHITRSVSFDEACRFWEQKEAKSVWQCAIYATIWSGRLERNLHTFTLWKSFCLG
ncbi:hypothetical protein PIB30_118464 [Stylosanthes scabra]|uniref:Reverse transcriptase zinc-binding domain-containing protein n=1 Tax=Stylosanthes scabra TaxID=79078 RepID=A0ABU6Z5A6_9FABA|nr:hypothetical protein [Stylosanthes scabra]